MEYASLRSPPLTFILHFSFACPCITFRLVWDFFIKGILFPGQKAQGFNDQQVRDDIQEKMQCCTTVDSRGCMRSGWTCFPWLVRCTCPESKRIFLRLCCSFYLHFQIRKLQEANSRGAHLYFPIPVMYLCTSNFPTISMTTAYRLTLFLPLASEFINQGFMKYHC